MSEADRLIDWHDRLARLDVKPGDVPAFNEILREMHTRWLDAQREEIRKDAAHG